MTIQRTKEAAETVLRELPSVIGAFVREDVFGHPREIHLLVRHGPNPRSLAYDVRDLLEERLGVPIDQRVISIAQLAPGRDPGPIVGGGEAADAPAAPAADAPDTPRVRFHGVSTEASAGRVRVRVRLQLDDTVLLGDGAAVDSPAGRCRAGAAAAVAAVNETCVGRARLEVDHAGTVAAFDRTYAVVTVLVSSPYLGRKPILLTGAHPVDRDDDAAGALAALKALNRVLGLILQLAGGSPRRRLARGRT
jgi:hypothetical protein